MDRTLGGGAHVTAPRYVGVINPVAEAALAAVVRNGERDYAEFVVEMERAILDEIPELDAVPGLVRQFGAVCAEHARGIRNLLRGDVQVEDLDQFALGASNLARDCAHWDISIASVLRTCQMGAELAWHWWTQRIEQELEEPELRNSVSLLCARLLMSYMNAGAKLIVAAHTEERERGLRGVSWQQREVVIRVLSGDEHHSSHEMAARLGYTLDAWHLAFVVWTADEQDDDLLKLEETARTWAKASNGETVLLIPGSSRSIWGWLGSSTPIPRERVQVGCRGRALVAVGQLRRGVAGFRDSHAEALQVQALAPHLATSDTVFNHGELATLALFSNDVAQLRRYVTQQLGGLAEASERAERIRETVRAYLAQGENARAVADDLHFHRNTITGRLDLAEKLRGRSLEVDRLGLAVALEITHFRGDEVLVEPS